MIPQQTNDHPTGKSLIRCRWRGATALLLLVVMPALSHSPLAARLTAQETSDRPGDDAVTRVEVLDAARESKMQETTEPTRTTVERGLRTFRRGMDFLGRAEEGWNGFHYHPGDFPAGAGFAYGMGFRSLAIGAAFPDPDLPNRFDLEVLGAHSNNGYKNASARLTIHNIGGSPISAAFGGQYYEHPEEDFFGLGAASLEDQRTSFLLESRDVDAEVWWQPIRALRVGGDVGYLSPSIGSGRDGRFPSAEQLFRPSDLPGFTQQPDFIRLGGWVDFDTRDNSRYPRAGGYYGVRFSDYHDQDLDAFDFQRWDLEAHHYLPLATNYRVLALRAHVVVTDTSDGRQVPFYYRPTLGGQNTLRGFREFRFRDRNSVLLTAEYRWQAWRILDPVVFVDAGKVAARRDDLDLSGLEVAYGIGFRFHTATKFTARLDLAKSREGFIPFLRFNHVF